MEFLPQNLSRKKRRAGFNDPTPKSLSSLLEPFERSSRSGRCHSVTFIYHIWQARVKKPHGERA
jgi:hypothetical protein